MEFTFIFNSPKFFLQKFIENLLTKKQQHIIISIVVKVKPVRLYADVAELVDAQDLKSCG